MKLFSKLRDYNNLLEDILDRKTFSSNSKNLLLSMIYKLEVCYKDYYEVKPDVISMDDFLNNILDIIKKYCDNIKTAEPNSAQAELLIKHNVEALTNSKERSILVYPKEQSMLYAICDIEPKYFFIKDDFIFKNVLQRVLVDGYKQNTIEILKNFNGWSWDINANDKNNCIENLIYQNLIFMKGEDFLYEWRMDNTATRDYLAELKRSIKKITGNDNYYLSLCKLLYLIAKTQNKKKIKLELETKAIEYQKFLNESEEFKKEHSRDFSKLKNYYAVLYNSNSAYEELLNLQKYFLVYIKKQIEKVTVKEEIMEIIYFLRYYQNINLFEGVLMKDYDRIKSDIDYVLKLAITKACKIGVIKIISMDIETNFEIIKYILDTRIIDLKEIRIYLEFENDDIFIKVYDKEVFEKQAKIKFIGNKKDIVIRKRKIVKLFN